MTKQEALEALSALRGYLNDAAEDDDYVMPDDALSLLADVQDYVNA